MEEVIHVEHRNGTDEEGRGAVAKQKGVTVGCVYSI